MKRLCVLLGLLAGCGTSDPATDRLAAGETCLIIRQEGIDYGALTGHHAAVERYAEGTGDVLVELVLLDGERAGELVTLPRAALRPITNR
jgi:hypothetical protein